MWYFEISLTYTILLYEGYHLVPAKEEALEKGVHEMVVKESGNTSSLVPTFANIRDFIYGLLFSECVKESTSFHDDVHQISIKF